MRQWSTVTRMKSFLSDFAEQHEPPVYLTGHLRYAKAPLKQVKPKNEFATTLIGRICRFMNTLPKSANQILVGLIADLTIYLLKSLAHRSATSRLFSTVSTCAERAWQQVIGVSLFMTFSGLLNTMTHTMKIVAPGEDFHTAGIDVIFVYLAPALIVALSGVVAGLLISARDRQLDFALIDISGADSWQLRAISCLDGFLMMVTAVFLSFVVVLISTLATSCALLKTVGVFSFSIQIRYWIVVFTVAALIGAVSTGIQGFKVNRDHSVELIAAAVGE